METGYQIQKVGRDKGPIIRDLQDAMSRLREKMKPVSGPLNLRETGDWEWGPDRAKPDAYQHVRSKMKNGTAGDGVIIRGLPREAQWAIWATELVVGPEVVQHARELLGLRYVWGGESETGGLDCSGLTLVCYEKVGVILPHNSDAQMHDPDVRPFDDRPKLKKGDLLFYNFGREPYPTVDHVGLFIGEDRTIDTRSTSSPVAIRTVEWGNIIHFGRVPQVNGNL